MMKLDQICSGFRVRRTAHLPELDAYLYEMEHEVTGAQLVWLDRMEENKTFMREQMTTAGHNAAMIRTMAGLSVEGAVYEYAGGISFFQWMDGMARDFQKSFPFLKNELTAMAKKIFCSNRMTVSITGDNDSKGRKAAESLARMLPKGICAPFNRKATIANVGILAKEGMRQTDHIILSIMTQRCD